MKRKPAKTQTKLYTVLSTKKAADQARAFREAEKARGLGFREAPVDEDMKAQEALEVLDERHANRLWSKVI